VFGCPAPSKRYGERSNPTNAERAPEHLVTHLQHAFASSFASLFADDDLLSQDTVMLSASSPHPSLEALSEFRRSSERSADTGRPTSGSPVDIAVAAHVKSCAHCQELLASVVSLAAATAQLNGPVASDRLKARILHSIEAKATAPTSATAETAATAVLTTSDAPLTRRWWMPIGAAAAALLAISVLSLLTSTPEVEAGVTAGTMQLSTTIPRAGERVSVIYRPGASLARFNALQLRARVRTVTSDSYTSTTPVVTVAALRRERDGSFTASFTLPDSIVFAALAVEDTAATEIDDQGGRTWEVFRADVNGNVSYNALDQRASDLMGRNWEEIASTTERMVQAFPDDLRAWSWLRTAQGWRGLPDDSVNAFHRGREAKFDSMFRAQADLPGAVVGQMYWYARGLDSTAKAYWRDRLMRDAPTNSFAIQNRLFDALDHLRKTHDTVSVLRTLDTLWNEAGEDRREQVANYSTQIAIATRDASHIRRWTDRILATSHGAEQSGTIRRVAMDFVRVPALRREGMDRLRAEIARLNAPAAKHRALTETRRDYRARLDRSVRATYAALGRALVNDGQHRAALEVLAMATATGWDYDIIRAVRTASFGAGDTTRALEMNARLAVDPRTPIAEVETLNTFGVARLGAVTWSKRVAEQRREFVERTLSATKPRTIARPVGLVALDGATPELRAMTKGQITVVAFWSRFCGPAVDALPKLNQLATQLGEEGIRTITIVEETQSSAGLTAFLKTHDVTLPVYLDAKKEASQAFNQWGTPNFYVLDASGRIVFEPTSDVVQLRVNVEVVRLAGSTP